MRAIAPMMSAAGLQRSVRRPFHPAQRPATFSRRLMRVQADLKVGDSLKDNPDYFRKLKTSEGNMISLSQFKDQKPIVLFFYPAANTPGCTKEACSFRDRYEAFVKGGAVVFGISEDIPEVNAAFAKSQRLPYPLLTDEKGFLRKSFGIKADLMGLLKGRQTYVIDKTGKVIMSFNDQLNAEAHVQKALTALSLA